MPVDADDAGTVRLHARTSPGASPVIHLAAACDAAGRHFVIPLNVRSVSGVVHNAIPRPVTDPAFHLPSGFDPAYAGNAELARYGFPRAARPAHVARRVRAVAGRCRSRNRPRGPNRREDLPDRCVPNDVRVKPDAAGKQYNTNNWSGIVATGVVTDEVEGNWTVPVERFRSHIRPDTRRCGSGSTASTSRRISTKRAPAGRLLGVRRRIYRLLRLVRVRSGRTVDQDQQLRRGSWRRNLCDHVVLPDVRHDGLFHHRRHHSE